MMEIDRIEKVYLRHLEKELVEIYCSAELIVYNNVPQIEFCIFDSTLESELKYRCFLIKEKVKWSYDELIFLRQYLNREVYIARFEREILLEKVKKHFKFVAIKDYDNPIRILFHVYYSLQKGTHEKLYKASLPVLAEQLPDDFEGSCPTEIFNGINIKALRALDSNTGVTMINTKDKCEKLQVFYQRYPCFFKYRLTKYQCEFIKLLLSIPEIIPVGQYNKFFNYFDNMSSYKQKEYIDYLILRHRLKGIMKFPLYLKSNVKYLFNKASFISKCLEKENKCKIKYDNLYEFEDEIYRVNRLISIDEILRESECQNNCLWELLEKILEGQLTILTCRRVDQPDKSFVTIAVIEEREVVEVLGKNNYSISESMTQWVLNYCRLKKLNPRWVETE